MDGNAATTGPDWDALYATAESQAGHFTTADATAAGYSSPLLHKYLASGRFARVQRGIYRVVHFPASEQEELVVVWLWSERAGVFSHVTALALYDLSDVLPIEIHVTLPGAWRRRRLRVPAGVVLHYADLDPRERQWHESVPITAPLRTLRDCIAANVAPDLVQQAVAQALDRGIVSPTEGADLERGLALLYGGAP